jgi:hypothetical protein
MKLSKLLVLLLVSLFWAGYGLADRYSDSDHTVTLQQALQHTTSDIFAAEKERKKEERRKAVFKYGIIAALIAGKVFLFSEKDK